MSLNKSDVSHLFTDNTDINKDRSFIAMEKKSNMDLSRISDIYNAIDSSFNKKGDDVENEFVEFCQMKAKGKLEKRCSRKVIEESKENDNRNFLMIGNKKVYYSNHADIVNDIIDHDLRKN